MRLLLREFGSMGLCVCCIMPILKVEVHSVSEVKMHCGVGRGGAGWGGVGWTVGVE